jgi:hypothetical protein
MEAARTSETSVDNYFTRQYIPEDKSELHTRRRENLKSHTAIIKMVYSFLISTTRTTRPAHLLFALLISIILIITCYSAVLIIKQN